MKKRGFKGQALTETALVLPAILLALLLAIDPFFLAVNMAVAKVYTFMAAREASVFMANGTTSCQSMATRVTGAAPFLVQVKSGNWSLTVTPCPTDLSWTTPTGQFVTATMTFHQDKVFWLSPTGTVVSTDIFQ